MTTRLDKLTPMRCALIVDAVTAKLAEHYKRPHEDRNGYAMSELAWIGNTFAMLWLDMATSDGGVTADDVERFSKMVHGLKEVRR